MSAPRERAVLVVGGGLAGLMAGYRLRAQGVDALVVEERPRPGGVVETTRIDGFEVEWGPQSFLDDAGSPVRAVAQELGLADTIRAPTMAARARFVAWRGRPRALPRELLAVLGLGGALRAMREAFVPRRRASPSPESVFAFAQRRFGPRVAARLFDPLVSGVFAGDAERLELQSAFPRLATLEVEHGSIVRSMLARGAPARRPSTFAGGMQALPRALAAALTGDGLRLGVRCEGIAPRAEGGFVAGLTDASSGQREGLEARAVLVATPAAASAALVASFAPRLAERLRAIPYAKVVSVALAFERGAFRRAPPEGFGVLVPRSEGLRMLGCIYPSACFPGAAPEGRVLLRVMLGGAHDPGVVDLSDGALVALARAEIGALLDVRPAATPVLAYVARVRPGIPQYEIGHAARAARIEEDLSRLPGLWLAGSAIGGISVGDVLAHAERQAARAAAWLAARTPAP